MAPRDHPGMVRGGRMRGSMWKGLLASCAIFALGSAPGWTHPAPPDRPLQGGAQEQATGKGGRTGTDSQAAESSEGVRKGESENRKGREPLKPDRPEAEDAAPAREEAADCDDCVIVLPEPAQGPTDGSAGEGDGSGSGHLAGTLWGLFMVSRPKRMPRTIIRGVNVP